MIYIDDDVEHFDLERGLALLSRERREKALSYKFEIDRKLCASAYLLLKRGLTLEFGFNEEPVFACAANGKPRLANRPEIHFNLAHCRRAAVCAIDRAPVGVDVEEIAPFEPGVARIALNRAEYDRVVHSNCPDLEFAILWTKKEALAKLSGEGIDDAELPELLKNVERYWFETIVVENKGYAATICRYKD